MHAKIGASYARKSWTLEYVLHDIAPVCVIYTQIDANRLCINIALYNKGVYEDNQIFSKRFTPKWV